MDFKQRINLGLHQESMAPFRQKLAPSGAKFYRICFLGLSWWTGG